ncbi:MAG: hypothetical protein SOR89_04105 [Ndongobacter sp.]|nr:hypothetical protein [Ndongobacter sp.]
MGATAVFGFATRIRDIKFSFDVMAMTFVLFVVMGFAINEFLSRGSVSAQWVAFVCAMIGDLIDLGTALKHVKKQDQCTLK